MIRYTLEKKKPLSSWLTDIPYVYEDIFKDVQNPKVIDCLEVGPYIIKINNF